MNEFVSIAQEVIEQLRKAKANQANLRRVLVVEDDPTDAFLAKCPLCAAGLEVDIAADAKSAVEMLFDNIHNPKEPDYVILFLDLKLHGPEDGLYVLRHVRTISPNLPVVIMTGADPGSPILAEALDLGYVGFIRKPLQKTDPVEIFQKHRLPIPVKPLQSEC